MLTLRLVQLRGHEAARAFTNKNRLSIGDFLQALRSTCALFLARTVQGLLRSLPRTYSTRSDQASAEAHGARAQQKNVELC